MKATNKFEEKYQKMAHAAHKKYGFIELRCKQLIKSKEERDTCVCIAKFITRDGTYYYSGYDKYIEDEFKLACSLMKLAKDADLFSKKTAVNNEKNGKNNIVESFAKEVTDRFCETDAKTHKKSCKEMEQIINEM